MEIGMYLIVGICIGAIIGWLWSKSKNEQEKVAAQAKLNELEKDFVGYKATTTAQQKTAEDQLHEKQIELEKQKEEFKILKLEHSQSNEQLASAKANIEAKSNSALEKANDYELQKAALDKKTE
jgi:uncharacterized membrane-anchored protein YhcB (DUF1043 family)